MPINEESMDLFERMGDGIILWFSVNFSKLINDAVPNTIDNRAINTKKSAKGKALSIFQIKVPTISRKT